MMERRLMENVLRGTRRIPNHSINNYSFVILINGHVNGTGFFFQVDS